MMFLLSQSQNLHSVVGLINLYGNPQQNSNLFVVVLQLNLCHGPSDHNTGTMSKWWSLLGMSGGIWCHKAVSSLFTNCGNEQISRFEEIHPYCDIQVELFWGDLFEEIGMFSSGLEMNRYLWIIVLFEGLFIRFVNTSIRCSFFVEIAYVYVKKTTFSK